MANNQNLRPPFDSESGRENQPKSVQKRKENQMVNQAELSVRATVKKILAKPVTDKKQLSTIEKSGLPVENPTYLDYLCASIIIRSVKSGRLDDLVKLMNIIGESLDDTDLKTLTKAAELLGGVDSAVD